MSSTQSQVYTLHQPPALFLFAGSTRRQAALDSKFKLFFPKGGKVGEDVKAGLGFSMKEGFTAGCWTPFQSTIGGLCDQLSFIGWGIGESSNFCKQFFASDEVMATVRASQHACSTGIAPPRVGVFRIPRPIDLICWPQVGKFSYKFLGPKVLGGILLLVGHAPAYPQVDALLPIGTHVSLVLH